MIGSTNSSSVFEANLRILRLLAWQLTHQILAQYYHMQPKVPHQHYLAISIPQYFFLTFHNPIIWSHVKLELPFGKNQKHSNKVFANDSPYCTINTSRQKCIIHWTHANTINNTRMPFKLTQDLIIMYTQIVHIILLGYTIIHTRRE